MTQTMDNDQDRVRCVVSPVLTGNSFLIADTLVETAPEVFAPVPGDVVVTDVIERDVTHCKVQTQH